MALKDFYVHTLLTERRYFTVVIVLIFLVFFSATFFIFYRHHTIHTAHILKEDRENANLLALILEQRLQRVVAVMESYSYRPLLLETVREKDTEKAKAHLHSLTKNDPDTDILIITDKKGTLWAAEPARPEVIGMNLAHREWYRGVSREWKTYISGGIKRIVREKDLSIQIAVPFIDGKGEVLGILLNTMRTAGLGKIVKQVELDPGASISIVDGKGQIIYSGRYDYEKEIKPYPFFDRMKKAVIARQKTFPVADPDLGGRMRYLSFAPIGDLGWTVFLGRDKESILKGETAYYQQVSATSLLLFVSIVLLLSYLKKQGVLQRLREQLQADNLNMARLRLVDFSLHQSVEKLLQMTLDELCGLTGSPVGFFHFVEPDQKTLFLQAWSTRTLAEYCRTEGNGLHYGVEEAGVWVDCIRQRRPVIHNDYASLPHRRGLPAGHPPVVRELVVPIFRAERTVAVVGIGNREEDYTENDIAVVSHFADFVWEIVMRKQAEETLRKLNTELEERIRERTLRLEAANRELESFSYSVSHDLRTPLRSIDGFSQALLEDYQGKSLDDTGKAYLERVRRATQRMGLLIDDMLKLSRITKAEMKREVIDLSGMVREIAREHQQADPARVIEVATQDGVVIKGDRYLLKVAIENLMDNAFKFTAKKANPRIEFGMVVENGRSACFIRDNGAGFDMAYAGKLFGAFQRLHTTDDFPGTGIGLATVQRIIHRHGGEIWAQGEVGRGAVFYFTVA